MPPTDEELTAHLVESRLAGPVATSNGNSLRNIARLVAGDPDCTMGMSDWKDASYVEVVGAVHALGGNRLDADPDTGWIDPAATLQAVKRHRRTLAGFVASGGGRVLLATGHPGPLSAHYAALGWALASHGCGILQPRVESVGYLDGVAALAYDGGRHHTHRSEQMEAMLAAVARVDLVIADHGFAGAAIEAGIPTLSIADVNDPGLPLAQARGRTDGVLLIDDGLHPSVFEPVTEAILDWKEHDG